MPIITAIAIIFFSIAVGFSFRSLFFEADKKTELNDVVLLGMVGFIGLSLLYAYLGLLRQLHFVSFVCLAVALATPGCLFLFKLLKFSIAQGTVGLLPRPWTVSTLIFLAPVFAIGLFVATMPPLNWDEISYALTFAKLHVLHGDIRYLSQYGIFSAFPIFGETAIGIPYLLDASPTSVHLVVLFFLAVSLFLIQELYFQFSSSKFYALLCVVGCAYLPLTLGNIGTAKIEPYQLSYILVSIFSLLLYRRDKFQGYRLLSYIFIGFAFGIKYTTIFAVPIYVCVHLISFSGDTKISRHLKEFGKLFLVALAVNSVWLLNNWINLCNPLFPNLVSIFGQCLNFPVTKDIMDMVSEGTMLQKNTSWATTRSLINFYEMFLAAFGVVNSLILICSFIVFLFNKKLRDDRDLCLMFVGIVLTMLIQAFAIYWEFRYTYFIFPIMLIFSVTILERINSRFIMGILLAGLFCFQAVKSLDGYIKRNIALKLVISGDISRAEYPEKFIHLYWVARYINENTPDDATIGFNWGVQPFFYLERKFFFLHDWNPEESLQELQTDEAFMNALKNKDISYLVWRNQDDLGYLDPSKSKSFHFRMNGFVDSSIQKRSLVLIHARDDVRIFKITLGSD